MTWQVRALLSLGLIVAILGGYIYLQSVKDDRDTYKAERDQLQVAYDAAISNQNKNFEVSNDYQTRLTDVNRKLAAALRVRDNAKCVPALTPGRPDAGTAGRELSGRDGISSDYLRDFAARCEKTRLQLLGLQSWATP